MSPSHTEDDPVFKRLVAAARRGHVDRVKAELAATTFDAYALANALYWTLSGSGSEEPSAVRIEGAKPLVDAGADVNHRFAYGSTALSSAVLVSDLEVVEFLIQVGANPLRPEGRLSGQTPLERAVDLGNAPIIAALRRAQPAIESADEFVEAATNGATTVVRAALDAGMNVDARDENGYPALLRAAAGGHPATVALLLSRGASPNSTSDDRAETALTAAVVGRSLESVKLLVEAGANVDLRRTYDNGTPLSVAEWLGCHDIARFLRERGSAAPV